MAIEAALRNVLITVARDTSAQVESASGGGASGGGGGGQTAKPAKESDEQKKSYKDIGKMLKKTIGVELSMGALLKQSQIFTGFMGSVFQLIGALVDVILAPLAPYLFKMVEIVANWIPKVGAASQATVDWLKKMFDKIADLSAGWTGIKTTAQDIVRTGLSVISINGLASIVGSSFASEIDGQPIGFKKFFTDIFKESDFLSGFKGALGKGTAGFTKIISFLKSALNGLTLGFADDLLKHAGKFLKGAGVIGAILEIGLELSTIISAFKEGNVGKAIFRIGLLILGIGIPIVLGIVLTGGAALFVPLIAGLIIGAASLMWDLLVPDTFKTKVYNWIGGIFGEIGDTFSELFSLGDGGFWSKLINLITKPFMLIPRLLASMFLSEGLKRTINDGFRSFLDTAVNGLIDAVNGIIRWAQNLIPDWVPGASGMKNWGGISRVDFSDMNLLLGVDSAGTRYNEGGQTTWQMRDANIALYGN
jgi:hypothetical protein